MADDEIASIKDVHIYMAEDAKSGGLGIESNLREDRYKISQDILMMIIDKLRHLNFTWEEHRRELDPMSGKPGSLHMVAVIRPHAIRTGIIEESQEVTIIFDTNSGPQAFAMSTSQSEKLSARLRAEMVRPPLRKRRKH